jgi:hypothetical protein
VENLKKYKQQKHTKIMYYTIEEEEKYGGKKNTHKKINR